MGTLGFYLRERRYILAAINIATLLFISGFLFVNFVRTGRNPGVLTACKSNMKNLGTAMEMYSSEDN